MAKFCSNCGNELVDEAVICPKCGVSVENKVQANNGSNDNSNGMATAGFILSFFVPFLGLIFSIIGSKRAKETNSGKGLSIAGIIISSIAIFISIIFIVIAVVAFNTIENTGYDKEYYNYYESYNYYE